MWGWRGRIGYILPGDFICAPEFYSVMPEEVALDVYYLGIERLVPKEMEKAGGLYLPAARHLAT